MALRDLILSRLDRPGPVTLSQLTAAVEPLRQPSRRDAGLPGVPLSDVDTTGLEATQAGLRGLEIRAPAGLEMPQEPAPQEPMLLAAGESVTGMGTAAPAAQGWTWEEAQEAAAPASEQAQGWTWEEMQAAQPAPGTVPRFPGHEPQYWGGEVARAPAKPSYKLGRDIPEESAGKFVAGAGELALSGATNLFAALPAIPAGIYNAIKNRDLQGYTEAFNLVQDYYTYHPKTEAGQALIEGMTDLAEGWSGAVDRLMQGEPMTRVPVGRMIPPPAGARGEPPAGVKLSEIESGLYGQPPGQYRGVATPGGPADLTPEKIGASQLPPAGQAILHAVLETAPLWGPLAATKAAQPRAVIPAGPGKLTDVTPVAQSMQRIRPPAGQPAAPAAAPEPPPAPAPGILHRSVGELVKPAVKAVTEPAKRAADIAADTQLGRATSAVIDDLEFKIAPMAAGPRKPLSAKTEERMTPEARARIEAAESARAAAKDYANAERLATWQWSQFDDLLNKRYTPQARESMGRALDEQSVLEQQGRTAGPGEGLNRLTPDERETVATLDHYGRELWARAKAIGMVEGEGLPSYMPRMLVDIGEDGAISRIDPRPSGPVGAAGQGVEPRLTPPEVGGNIRTTTPQLKAREYLTPEETQAAAQAKFGQGVALVRDIRALPLALSRFERAIAGRELIDSIKATGARTGQELVSTVEGPEYFTIDNPAFKTYRPRMRDGQPVLDAQGNVVMDKVPLYVRTEFEGPLKAIMSEKPGAAYSALMDLKGRTMSVIMYSPAIHNLVEWGRAMPVKPVKVLTGKISFEGNAAKRTPELMRQAIDDGMVPIGHRAYMQDITGLIETPDVVPGRSWTAKAAGGAVGLVSKEAGQAVKRGIDVAGDFWHNTLLWERVGDLQMGLYTNMKADLLKKGIQGMDERTAGRVAAHFANRYAGALPNESMSNAARKAANLLMFSRTFTLGNLGVVKDMITGLPKDVQAQILRDAGAIAKDAAVSASRRKSWEAFIIDIGMGYIANDMLEDALDVMKRDKSLSDIERGYAQRFASLMQRADESPLDAALDITDLLATSEHEPGKEERVLYGYDDNGTAIYLRLPVGKVGEDFRHWMSEPAKTARAKLSTFARPALEVIMNERGFGRQVFNPDESVLKNAGDVVKHIVTGQLPMDAIEGVQRYLTHAQPEEADIMKALLPLVGVTVSRGAPGGMAKGAQLDIEERYRNRLQQIKPQVRDLIKRGREEEAIELMSESGMTPREIINYLASIKAPRLSPRAAVRAMQHATPQERRELAEYMRRQLEREREEEEEGK
jgi:hypothetical protein